MSYVIFANNAPNYYNFFVPLSRILKQKGCQVTWFFDSNYSKSFNGLSCDYNNVILGESEELSADEHILISDLVEQYISEKGFWCFYPDYDRNNYYKTFDVKEADFYSNLLFNIFVALESLNKKCQFTHFLYENPSNAIAIVSEWWCRRNNKNYLGISRSRYPGYIIVSNDWRTDNQRVERNLSDLLEVRGDANDSIKQYIDNLTSITPDYMVGNFINEHSVTKKYFNIKTVSNALFKIKFLFSKNVSFQVGNPVITSLNSFIRNIKRSIKIRSGLIKYSKVDERDNYYLYPLHFHPEASTSVLSKEYDEFELIKNIAFNLPPNRFLYVKDHISSKGYFSLEEYRRIRCLPNVKLINPEENAKVLAKDSMGVFTLSSTVGYEALLMGVNIVVWGDVFYSCHKNAMKATGVHDLKSAFEFLERKIDVEDLHYYNCKFVEAYLNLGKKVKIDFKETNSVVQEKLVNEFCISFENELGL